LCADFSFRSELTLKIDQLFYFWLLEGLELLSRRGEQPLILRDQLHLLLGCFYFCLKCEEQVSCCLFCFHCIIQVYKFVQIIKQCERVLLRLQTYPRRVPLPETIYFEGAWTHIRVINVLDFAVLRAK